MPRPRTDIAPRLLRAARDLFLAHGVDGAPLRKIARAAKTNIGMLYYYYPTKDELFLAVVEEVYVELLADLEAALAPDVPVPERLRRLYRRVGEVSDDELQIIRLIAREMLVSSDRRARLVERFQRGHLPMLLTTLIEGVRDGALDPALPLPVLLLVTFAVGAVPQFVRRAFGDQPPFGALPGGEQLADLLIHTLLHGVGR